MPIEKDGKTVSNGAALTEREREIYRDLGVEDGYREIVLMRMDEMKSDIKACRTDFANAILALPCRSFTPPFCPTPLSQIRPPSNELIPRSKTGQGHQAITEEVKKQLEDSQQSMLAELTLTAEQAALHALQTRMDTIEEGREQARKELQEIERARAEEQQRLLQQQQQQIQQRRGKWQFGADMIRNYAVPAIVAVLVGLGVRCDQRPHNGNGNGYQQVTQQFTPSTRPAKK